MSMPSVIPQPNPSGTPLFPEIIASVTRPSAPQSCCECVSSVALPTIGSTSLLQLPHIGTLVSRRCIHRPTIDLPPPPTTAPQAAHPDDVPTPTAPKHPHEPETSFSDGMVDIETIYLNNPFMEFLKLSYEIVPFRSHSIFDLTSGGLNWSSDIVPALLEIIPEESERRGLLQEINKISDQQADFNATFAIYQHNPDLKIVSERLETKKKLLTAAIEGMKPRLCMLLETLDKKNVSELFAKVTVC